MKVIWQQLQGGLYTKLLARFNYLKSAFNINNNNNNNNKYNNNNNKSQQ